MSSSGTPFNLVAPALQLANLPKDDPAVVQLRGELKDEVGIPEELTNRIVAALEGVDHLGSLLKVDTAIEEAIDATDREFERKRGQGDLFGGFPSEKVNVASESAKLTMLDAIERFLTKHSQSADLGLRLDGEQLAAGVRFVRIAKEGTYDLVVGNPPYQGTSKMTNAAYVATHYPRGKADLYAAFLQRALELARPGGLSALLTMRGWMFLGQFAELRKHLLHSFDLRNLGDFDRGAFDEVPNEVLAITMSTFRRAPQTGVPSVAAQPTSLADKSYDRQRTNRKRAAVLAQVGRYEFDPRGFEVIEGEPIVYWWTNEFLERYGAAPKLGSLAAVRQGLATSANARFLRRTWEVPVSQVGAAGNLLGRCPWAPYVKGGAGAVWMEAFDDVIDWWSAGLAVKAYAQHLYGSYTRTIKNEAWYFCRGVCFTKIGNRFDARAYRYASVFDVAGSSVFPGDIPGVLALLNSSTSRFVLESLNPTVNFQVGDVNRLPVFQVPNADDIYSTIERAFAEHESHRETSFEFQRPGPSAWSYTQDWAQCAVDRPPGAPLPSYEPAHESATPEAHVSFALGVALGRFGANGEGILDEPPASAFPVGLLFVTPEGPDCLEHSACARLCNEWHGHGTVIGGGDDLRTYLRKSFFGYHKKLHENRPIYFPLSSTKRSFVAFISIHRWKDDTLSVLLADYLMPERRRLEGELEDLRKARSEKGNKAKAEKRFAEAQKLLEELNEFIDKVIEVAERGPPPPDDKTPPREVDARYVMDLDDGVVVNSAALWPLLEPQWKDPKKWWRELATAQGRKDYDWAHLAARYFPKRVAEKCEKDPSLAVAHKCFWRLHPAKAYAWELRLQDEVKPDFMIDEPGSEEARANFLAEHEREAAEIHANEMKRRDRKARKADDAEESDGPLFDRETEDVGEEDEVANA